MKFSKIELVEINVPAGTTQQKFYFPDNSVIRSTPSKDVLTKALIFYPSQAVTKAPSGATNMSSVDLCKAYLVLYINNGEFYKIPVVNHIATHSNDATAASAANYPYNFLLPELDNLNVNWPKSYVLFPEALAATGLAIVCAISYFSTGQDNN